MKKILLLGGAMQQIPCIQESKKLGYYVITCDYFPDNPGHKYADEYHNVSTTDKEGVLKLAKVLKIDGIVAYASDPAAPTAAYVANSLNLVGSPYESVKILTQKDLFRNFLKENKFNVPAFGVYKNYESLLKEIDRFTFPIMVKPVDSSGSKGVVKVYDVGCLKNAVFEALSYSRNKTIVAEEFIIKKGYQVSGDGFSIDGKLVFTSYGNELYSNDGVRDYVALGEFWPSLLTKEQKNRIDKELQRLITALNMTTSAYNIEVILDKDDNVYILELGARNGGSYIPQLIKYATGVDLVEYTIKAFMGQDVSDLKMVQSKGFWSNYMLFSRNNGTFKNIKFDKDFKENNLLKVYCTKKIGERVSSFSNTSHSLGTIIFKADNLNDLLSIINNIDKKFEVIVDRV